MAKVSPIQSNFNAGELSPSLSGRVDIAKYKNGLAICENFIPMVQGPARRRSGTRFVAEVKDSSQSWTRLSPFRFNTEQSYMLEWGDGYVRFYTERGVALNGGVPLEVPTFYAGTELLDANNLFRLRFAQSGDVIYIAHRNHFPAKLERFSDTNWQLGVAQISGFPFDATNDDDDIAVYASDREGTISIIASSPIWESDLQVGEYFYLEQQNIRNVRPWEVGKTVTKGQLRRYNGVTYLSLNAGTTGSVPPTHLTGEAWDSQTGSTGILWQYQDAGYGWAKLISPMAASLLTPISIGGASHLHNQPPQGARTITAVTSANPVQVTTATPHGYQNGKLVFITDIIGTEDLNGNFYFVANATANTFTLQDSTGANIDGSTFADYISGGTVTDTLYGATAIVESRLPVDVVGSDNATGLWAHGAWSDYRGYPDQVVFSYGRLFFARDGNVWASVSQDFENFANRTPGGQVTSDMAVSIELPGADPIQWMLDGANMLVGTTQGEWIIGPLNQSAAFGPDNVQAVSQLTLGSRNIPAVKIGQSIVMVQTSGRKLREFSFQFIYNNYAATDLTALADHLTMSGRTIRQLAYQEEPDSIIWCCRDDGLLMGFTFNKEMDVTGWHRHPLGGNGAVESIASIPAPLSSGMQRDDLWMIVNRFVNGASRRYVEFMSDPFDLYDDIRGACFLDCAITGNFPGPVTNLSGLDFLAGETIDAIADGNAVKNLVVGLDGTVTMPYPASWITLGYRTPAKLMTMPIEAGAQDGTALGKTQRLTNVRFNFLATLGGKYGDPMGPTGKMDHITFKRVVLGGFVPPFTGIWPPDYSPAPWPEGYEVAARIAYWNDEPFPATVASIMPQLETQDRG